MPGCPLILLLWSVLARGLPDDARSVLARAATLVEQEHSEAAAALLGAWCQQAPTEGERWLASARLLLQRHVPGPAEGFAHQAFALLPRNEEACGLLGTCYLLTGRLGEAEAHYDRAIARFGDSAEVHFQLGMACSMNQKLSRAAEEFGRALELDPSHAIARFWAGETCARVCEWEQAEQHFREAARSAQNPDARWKLAEALAHQGRDREAEETFVSAAATAPPQSRLRALFHHAVFLFERHRLGEAEERLQQVTLAWPEHRTAWHYLARTRQQQGQAEAAQEALARYQALQQREDSLETEALLRQIRTLPAETPRR